MRTEENHLLASGPDELTESFVIDGGHLEVNGNQRTASGSEPIVIVIRHFERDSLIHDFISQLGNATPIFERKQYRFDEFTTLNSQNTVDGSIKHAYDGAVNIVLPDGATPVCRRGDLYLNTVQSIDETGENTQEFTGGRIFIDRVGSIHFFDSGAVKIRSPPGFDPVALDDGTELLPFGGCFY